jgi:hypothetical protein
MGKLKAGSSLATLETVTQKNVREAERLRARERF